MSNIKLKRLDVCTSVDGPTRVGVELTRLPWATDPIELPVCVTSFTYQRNEFGKKERSFENEKCFETETLARPLFRSWCRSTSAFKQRQVLA